jgi:hypothetical protein
MMRESEETLRKLRELIKTTLEAAEALRDSLGALMPVVVSTTPEIPRAVAETLHAYHRADEPLTNAIARLVEVRAHLALAQPALAAFNALRASGTQKVVELAAERRAESGEKPS